MSKFDRKSTTNEVLEGIDLTAKNIMITGGSGGLGKETARALASKGAKVTIVALEAELENLNKAAADIEESTGNKVEIGTMDLSKPASIRSFVETWMENHDKLDILINNAGVAIPRLVRSEDGVELNMAINYMGHFLLTNLLVPALKASGNARVVSLSSAGHRMATPNLDDINYENSEFNPAAAYPASKTAVLWFSNEFDRRHKDDNIRSFAIHPGTIAGTGLLDNMPKEVKESSTEAYKKMGILMTVEQGAATSCWGATSEELADKGGLYLQDCNICTYLGDPDNIADPNGLAPHSFDEESEKKLWTVTNEFMNTNF